MFRVKNDKLQVKVNGRFKTISNITNPHDVVKAEYDEESRMIKITTQSLLDLGIDKPYFFVEAYKRRQGYGGQNSFRRRNYRRKYL